MSVQDAVQAVYGHTFPELFINQCCLYMNRCDYIPDDLLHYEYIRTMIPHYFKLTCYLPYEKTTQSTHILYCDFKNQFRYVSIWRYIHDFTESGSPIYTPLGDILMNTNWELIDSN